MFHFGKTLFIFFDAVMSKCGHEQHLKINNHTGWHNFCFFGETRQEKRTYITTLAWVWTEKTMGGRLLCKDNKEIVFMTDAARKKTQLSGMLLLCFKSLCERLSGQLCVDSTSLGYTHTKHKTGPLMGAHTSMWLCLSRSTSAGSNKTRERFIKTDYCDWFRV